MAGDAAGTAAGSVGSAPAGMLGGNVGTCVAATCDGEVVTGAI